MERKRLFILLALLVPAVLVASPLAASAEDGPPTEGGKPVALPWPAKKIADTIQDLSAPEWSVRKVAIREVVHTGPWIVPFLMVALKNPEKLNRIEVAYCLGRLGDPVAVPSLVEVIQEEPPYDVLTYTLMALGELGDAKALDVVRPLAKYHLERERYDRQVGDVETKVIDSREATVRHAAVVAMARLGDTSGLPILIENLKGNGWVRRDAIVHLRRLTGCEVDFGFYLDMKADDLDTCQKAWFAWWEKNKDTFQVNYTESREVLDVYMPRDAERGGDKDGEKK